METFQVLIDNDSYYNNLWQKTCIYLFNTVMVLFGHIFHKPISSNIEASKHSICMNDENVSTAIDSTGVFLCIQVLKVKSCITRSDLEQ